MNLSHHGENAYRSFARLLTFFAGATIISDPVAGNAVNGR